MRPFAAKWRQEFAFGAALGYIARSYPTTSANKMAAETLVWYHLSPAS